jgi:hypothetical protein
VKVNSEQTYHIKDENEQCLKRTEVPSTSESEKNTHSKVRRKAVDEEPDFCFVLGYN